MARSKSLPKVLSREDAARIVCAPDPLCPSGLRNRVAMQLMYRCGLRVGEVCNLQPAHVDLKQGYVLVLDGKDTRRKPKPTTNTTDTQRKRKNHGKDRTIPLDPDTILWCQRWLAQRPPSKYFLCATRSDRRGRKLSDRYLRQMMERLSEELGIHLVDGSPIHPHTLRHCFATERLEDGFGIHEVAALCGHESIATTQIYLSVRPGALAAKMRTLAPVGA